MIDTKNTYHKQKKNICHKSFSFLNNPELLMYYVFNIYNMYFTNRNETYLFVSYNFQLSLNCNYKLRASQQLLLNFTSKLLLRF